jgi:hypothetical protein
VTPNLWFHPAFFNFISAIFLPIGNRKKKKRERGDGLELMHATDLFENKNVPNLPYFEEK